MKLLLAIFTATVLLVAPSAAQVTAGKIPAPASGDPLGFENQPTVEEALARIRAMLGGEMPFSAAGPAIIATGPEIERGGVILALPVQPRRVGRLRTALRQ